MTLTDEKPPHNLEAEQALLGAIFVNNEALERVSSFLTPQHFYDPLHGRIFETLATLIHAGKTATPVTVKPFFENTDPIDAQTSVPQYLGKLAANATTIINAHEYGRTIYDLATRRALIIIGEDMVNTAYHSKVDQPPQAQIEEVFHRLDQLKSEQDPATKITAMTTSFAEIVSRPINWLWRENIALGKITLIAGQPGLGKSQITCALAAAVSNGTPLPDGTKASSGSVVFITCEDDPGDTIKPRLLAAGAAPAHIHILSGHVKPDGKEILFDLGAMEGLYAMAEQHPDLRLVVIDPVSAYMGAGIDSHKNSDVRAALNKLSDFAVKARVAIVLVTHLNKGTTDGSAIGRVTGSGAFVAAARAAFLVEKDPDDETGKRRVLAPLKNNIGNDSTGFSYAVEGHTLADGIKTSRVRFDGTIEISAKDLLTPQQFDREERSVLAEAVDFLKQTLGSGSQPSIEVQKAAKSAGVSLATLRRAKEKLGVKARKASSGGWEWHLCQTDAHLEPLEHVPEFTGVKRSQAAPETGIPFEDAQVAQGAHCRRTLDSEHLAGAEVWS